MKKNLLFFSCVLLLLPLVFICTSAYDPRDGAVRAIPSDSFGYPYLYTFSYEPSQAGTLATPFYSNGDLYYGIYFQNAHDMFYYTSSDYSTHELVYTSGVGWVDDNYRFIYLPTPVDSSHSYFLNLNEYSAITPYVGTALNFGGQVLNFIVSTEGILSLLGLSIGLFLIVPFSIRKIKDFVKGY